MQKSLIIARLIGPVLSAIGIGMLVNQPTYREMAAQFVGGLPFIYFFGILALVAGLYILNVHNAFFVGAGIVLLGLGGFITFKGYME